MKQKFIPIIFHYSGLIKQQMQINFSFGFISDEEIINNLNPRINQSSSKKTAFSGLNKKFSLNGCSYYVFDIESFFDVNEGIFQIIYSQTQVIENIFKNVNNIHQRYSKLFSESNVPINYKIYILFSILFTIIIWLCLKLFFSSALILFLIIFLLSIFIHIYYLYPRNFSLVMQLDNFISSLLKVLTRCENIEKLFRNNNIIIIEINHCDGLINFHYRDLKQLKTDFPNIQMMDKKKSDFYNEMLDLFKQEIKILQKQKNIFGYIDFEVFNNEKNNYRCKIQQLKEKFKLNENNEFN